MLTSDFAKRSTGWILNLLILLPALAVLVSTKFAGELPDLDYWYTLERFTDQNGLALNKSFFTLHSNEHLVPIAGLLYVVNILAFHGSNIGLCFITWMMGVIQVFVLTALLPQSCKTSLNTKKFWIFIISLFVFTPAAHHNWLRGMSGASWITANTFAVIAMYLFVKATEKSSWGALFGCALTALCAATSYSTGLMIWPLLGLASLVFLLCDRRNNWRPIAVLSVVVIPLVALVIISAERPAHHAAPKLELSFKQHGEFIFELLGGTFNSSLLGLLAIGFAVIGVVILCLPQIRSKFKHGYPWALLIGYPLLNAITSAVFRSDRFMNAASASRYGSLPSLFILFVLILFAALLPRHDKRLQIVLGIFALILGIYPYFEFRGEIARQIRYQEEKEVAALSIKLGIPDRELILRSAMRDFDRFESLFPRLKLMQHVPFEPESLRCAELGSIPEKLSSDVAPYRAAFAMKRPLQGNKDVLRVEGRISPVIKEKCLLIMDSNGTVVGRAFTTRNYTSARVDATPGTVWAGYLNYKSDLTSVWLAKNINVDQGAASVVRLSEPIPLTFTH